MKVYGFGSYFDSRKSYRDIDILIVHQEEAEESCMRAIETKSVILTAVNDAHVSILSASAEKHFSFIARSGAILLGTVDENSLVESVRKISSKLSAFRKI